MKLWNKGFNTERLVDQFTVGNDRLLDLHLARYDILATKAHVTMLNEVSLISNIELENIIEALKAIEIEINEGTFVIEDMFEDVHSKIEYEVTKLIGESGKKIHTARSRNDQVLVALHLYAKDQIIEIKESLKSLFDVLIGLAKKHQDVLLPGYTHLQIAMPSSFGLWFSSYAESFIDDLILLNGAYEIADQNPLGTAAGYGTSFPIDRKITSEILGFKTLKFNSVAAQMSRGKLEIATSYALAMISSTLSKFASDIILYMSQNFGFIKFPKELTTGSSIMPHKQNPDVFELIRAKSNKIQSLPQEITMITSNLSSGYHRDFQLLKEGYINGIETVKQNLQMTNYMISRIEVNTNILDNDLYDPIYTVEEVNRLVMEGNSFREAYKKVGKKFIQGEFKPNKDLHHTHIGSIGNLCLDEIQTKFNIVYSRF